MTTINDFNFENKKALIRVDFNVPLDENFTVTDTTRITSAKPTILKILEDGGSVVLMSHLGRPKGTVNPAMSLAHICDAVSEIIGVKVKFVSDCIGADAEQAVSELQNGEVLLLENLRFHPEEEKGDKAFAEGQPLIEIGYTLGFNATTKNDDALDIPSVSAIVRELTASNDISIGSQAFSNHIQITNLPIISQNGVVSSVNKTIYIVDSLCIDHQHDDTSYRYYCDKAPYPLWVDLNNLETIELNKIDILITTDSNTPQTALLGSTQLVIQFRDKTSGAIINSIPVKSTPITNTY